MDMQPIHASIWLVDADAKNCTAFRTLLESNPLFKVTGESMCYDDLERIIEAHRPHIVVLDINILADDDSEKLIRRFVRRYPHSRFLAVTHALDTVRYTRFLKAGVAGIVLRASVFEDLIIAVQTVLQGNLFLSAGAITVLTDAIINEFHTSGS